MGLRIVHKLSLLLLATVFFSVLGLGGMLAWNLRNGFAEYLAARDLERLEQFAALVAQSVDRAGGIGALSERRLDMRELLREFAEREGLSPRYLPQPSLRPPAPPPDDDRSGPSRAPAALATMRLTPAATRARCSSTSDSLSLRCARRTCR